MTPQQLELIRNTSRAVEAHAELFGTLFYERLFALAPKTRPLFPDDLTAQRGKLVEELVFLAEAATDLPAFVVRARDLGVRHHAYGVRPHDYDTLCSVLLGSLSQILGDRWTPATEEAWQSLYRLISETMLEGAAGSLFASSA